jgi:hypothetical protein
MLAWRYYGTPTIKIFDPFGRSLLDDVHTSEFDEQSRPQLEQINEGECYQDPDSSSCGNWILWAFLIRCLQIGHVKGIRAVQYSGNEDDLDNLNPRQKAQTRDNDMSLLHWLNDHYLLFEMTQKKQY